MTERNIITDEMVVKAWNTMMACSYQGAPAMRAALEAVAPMLIAQGMREAAGMMEGMSVFTILARAQEIDPQ
jgi:hypothetical protein